MSRIPPERIVFLPQTSICFPKTREDMKAPTLSIPKMKPTQLLSTPLLAASSGKKGAIRDMDTLVMKFMNSNRYRVVYFFVSFALAFFIFLSRRLSVIFSASISELVL